MKKVFIDCGSRDGDAIKRFMKTPEYDSEFVLYAFEPLKTLFTANREIKNIKFSNQAIWTKDGTIDFYVSRKKAMWGSTLIKNKTSGNIDKEHPVQVPCLDFSQWILNNFSIDDYVVVSMDIEGAEYDVLEKMIKDGSVKYIKKMYVEFHYDRIGLHIDKHNDLVDRLNKRTKLYLEEI